MNEAQTNDMPMIDSVTQGDVFIGFYGCEQRPGQGDVLPSWAFLYEVHIPGDVVNVTITYEEVGNAEPEDAAYDTTVEVSSEGVGARRTLEAINAAMSAHMGWGHHLPYDCDAR